MGGPVFKEGGQYNIRQVGQDKYSVSIEIPTDQDGLSGRNCPSELCSPAYFKVKPGTGMTGQQEIFCPYCRHPDDPSNFFTNEQIRYAKEIVMREMHKEVGEMIKDSLGIGPSGHKKLARGFLSMELSYKPGDIPHVRRPVEEELRRDVKCPQCGLEHAVFGLAAWCPDCGADIFMTHVEKELGVVRSMLGDIERRRTELGLRVAAKDAENALEDTVSIFEAVLRVLTRRHMKEKRFDDEKIDDIFRSKIGNRFQNIEFGKKLCNDLIGADFLGCLSNGEFGFLKTIFEKRHPITHNLGIIDRKYLEKVRSGELEGRDIPVTAEEIGKTIDLALKALANLHKQLFRKADNQSRA